MEIKVGSIVSISSRWCGIEVFTVIEVKPKTVIAKRLNRRDINTIRIDGIEAVFPNMDEALACQQKAKSSYAHAQKVKRNADLNHEKRVDEILAPYSRKDHP